MIRFPLATLLLVAVAMGADKPAAVARIRQQFAANRKYIHYSVRGQYKPENTAKWLLLLEDDGRFSDLHLDGFTPEKYNGGMQKKLAGKLMEAWKRIRLLAQLILDDGDHKGDEALKAKLMKSAVHYGDIELRRCDGWFRFHVSCFGIPRIAYGVYFAFFEELDAAEKAKDTESLAGRYSLVLQGLMRQTFTQPRRDSIKDPYTADQFRKHVWWVGGNFAYRPTFEAAAVCSDTRMFDVIAEVCAGGLSAVSHNTLKDSFWSEGICADGAGWGHGPQCYVWGYPSDGVSSILGLLKRFRDTPWEAGVPPTALQAAADYVEGMCWYQYLGRQTLLSPGRSGFSAGPGAGSGRIAGLAGSLLGFQLPEATKQRVEQIRTQIEAKKVAIHGTRVFWNNDDIVRRHPEYYVGVNMVSARTQSNEVVADGFSLYTDFFGDGTTFIHRDGLEYGTAKGAWDVAAIPGTTTRETQLKPVRLWGGYRGVHNLAGGVDDGQDGCAGFVYEKGKSRGSPNPGLYGIRAQKSYFFVGDSMICLGAGIENVTPDTPGTIRTTIDQPEWRDGITVVPTKGKRFGATPDEPVRRQYSLTKTGDLTVKHNGIAYTILASQTKGSVELVAETKPTDWVARHGGNKRRKDLPKEVPVLRLGIDHGDKPVGSTYGYVVQPLGKQPIPVQVVANTPELQAVATPDDNLIQAIIFSPKATLEVGKLRLRVSAPAALMLRRQNGKATLTVADLTQDPSRKELLVESNLPGASPLRIPLPTKPNCGKAAQHQWAY